VPARLRREEMLAVIREREFARVTELAERFSISEVTVRSDLDALAERGHVRRVRGGAVARSLPHPERSFEETAGANIDEKQAIGRAAAALLADGETVVLDVGTTTTAVARALTARMDLRDVTVFTNGLTTALELEAAAPRVTVVVTGGTLRPLQHSLVDPMGGLLLEQIHVRTAVIGCNGVDPDAGVTNINLPEAAVKRRMLAAAQRRVVVADGSKIGEVALAQLCPIDDVDLLITGSSADPDVVAALRDRGLQVEVAS
jgi:DeoR family transcriptional regulator, aga operon transcriptional repressor